MRRALLLLMLSGCGGCGPVDRCAPCEDDADCGGSFWVSETGMCQRGFCCGVSDYVPACGLRDLRGQCPQLFDGDASNAELDTSRLCEPCASDAACGDDAICSEGLCCLLGDGSCPDLDCDRRGACEPCETDDECARLDLPAGASLCVQGVCCPESEPGSGCGFTELKVLCGEEWFRYQVEDEERTVCDPCTADETCGGQASCVAGVCCPRVPGPCAGAEARALCGVE